MVTGSELEPVAATEELAVGTAVIELVAAVLVADPLPLPLPLPLPAVCDGEVLTSLLVELDTPVALEPDWPTAPELVPGTLAEPVEGALEGTGVLDGPEVDEVLGLTGLLVEGVPEAEDELCTGVGETVNVKVTRGVDEATGWLEEEEPPGMTGVLDEAGVLEAAGVLEETGLLEADVPGMTGVLDEAGVLEAAGVLETTGLLEETGLLEADVPGMTGVLDEAGVLEAAGVLEETGLLEADVPGMTGVLDETGMFQERQGC
ncbi:hypothetical protein CNMCM5623_008353 [Aspergillus felis]|uniref:Uncharacterized protein n=1 Tax=Aspergillus felis TaxID=1287682 RepID=A0A8H6QIM4_9EURO|nr:hypothetical protein CNMCM5623_008353 [Aspergillus felis]